jgi:hypothetical protein
MLFSAQVRCDDCGKNMLSVTSIRAEFPGAVELLRGALSSFANLPDLAQRLEHVCGPKPAMGGTC